MLAVDEYEYLFHEIKNNICVVDGSLQLLAKKHPEVQEFSYWDEVVTDVSHLLGICTVVSASRLHNTIHKKLMDPSILFHEIQKETLGLLNEETTCIFLIDKTLPALWVDPIQIRHALINLIKNSSEAIRPDSKGQITVSADAVFSQDITSGISKINTVRIQIQDNGQGISPENLDKVFLPSYSGKPNGAGLGLTITRQIVEAHGGTISCKSDSKNGTVFTILLPAAVEQNP